MPTKLLVIFGATGNQGGSVANHVLKDPELSKEYSIRAITRSASHANAQALKSKGAEVVEADLDDAASLAFALAGAHTIFALTNTQDSGNTRAIETAQAKALCDEAIKSGAQYLIWSTLPHANSISGGKLKVEHFDVKAEIERYIRDLPIKSSFFSLGFFMQNFASRMSPRSSPANDGSYVLANLCYGNTLVPLADATDTGKWVGAILAEPDKYEGKVLSASQGLYTWDEIAAIIAKVTERKVIFQNVPDEVFRSWLPEEFGDDLQDMYLLIREYGYYGKTMNEDILWTVDQARSRLTSLEEYLKKEEFKLE